MKKILSLLAVLVLLLCTAPATSAEDCRPETDYMDIVMRAAVCGDIVAGRAAMNCYNEQLDRLDSDEARLDFDELFLLSKLIFYEAGDERFSDELRICVGEVVLNRAASPEFPGSIKDVIFQPGQYDGVASDEFAYIITPSEPCVKAAVRLLRGERLMEPSVVFQADSAQGGGLYRSFYDYSLGNIYFCTSSNAYLYPAAENPIY